MRVYNNSNFYSYSKNYNYIISILIVITFASFFIFTEEMLSIFGAIFTIMVFSQIYFASRVKKFYDGTVKSLLETKKRLDTVEKDKYLMTNFDKVTMLPNEKYMLGKIRRNLLEDTSKKAILIFEIDQLTEIKSALSTDHMNQLLRLITGRLKRTFSTHLLGKLEGNQFVLLIEENKSEEIIRICKQLISELERPFQIQSLSFNISINIGVAYYVEEAKNEEEIIKFAQFAMFEARKSLDHFAFYESTMSKVREDRMFLVNDLYQALQRGDFSLHYQPQLKLKTKSCISMEALLRWNHPERGVISPAEFIPIAEESGLIVPIGKWVLETACRQTKELQSRIQFPVKVAVNLSIRQLIQEDFVEVVRGTLLKTNLAPECLQLEITESMTMEKEFLIPIIRELKELGVSIALDDFGKGYSSLSYLKNLPIDCLKIDREFIKNMNEGNREPVVDLIITMAKQLNLCVVAEGVETMEQFDYLLNSQCDAIQGFLISKPVCYEKIINNIKRFSEKISYIPDTQSNYFGFIKNIFH